MQAPLFCTAQVEECWEDDPRKRPTFVAIAHRIKKADPVLLGLHTTTHSANHTTLFSDEEAAAATAWFAGTEKSFVAFLSHHKEDCATEARLVKGELDNFFEGGEAFLDSDNLQASQRSCVHM